MSASERTHWKWNHKPSVPKLPTPNDEYFKRETKTLKTWSGYEDVDVEALEFDTVVHCYDLQGLKDLKIFVNAEHDNDHTELKLEARYTVERTPVERKDVQEDNLRRQQAHTRHLELYELQLADWKITQAENDITGKEQRRKQYEILKKEFE